MKSNIILLILLSIFCTSCCNTSSNNITETDKSDSLTKEIKMDYIHSYDTSYHSEYSNNPDSLFQLMTHYKTNKTAEADFYKQLSESNQGKCFIQKMKEMHSYAKLSDQLKLPNGAQIIETKKIASKKTSDRMLILWMINPYVNITSDNDYISCSEYLTGKAYFEGRTYVSLISTTKHEIINTLQIEHNYTILDTIDNKIIHKTYAANIIPISALKRMFSGSAFSGKYYTTNSTDSTDGKVEILYLEDFNQDGKPYEFAMFESFACACTYATLYGYSTSQDKLIHYVFEKTYVQNTWKDTVLVLNKDTMYAEKDYWVDALFSLKPKPFPVSFSIDYRGRGGDYNYYLIDYDRMNEVFKETIDSRYKQGDEDIHPSWMPMVH